ncbi:MAG: DUF4445 domain-containing protein [Lachnospiraceae bacterium]|nr:DUF4445 domain-containing protein [Lachnospiraceae bacterium]
MSENRFRGTRCDVCIGCGRCVAANDAMQVVTAAMEQEDSPPLWRRTDGRSHAEDDLPPVRQADGHSSAAEEGSSTPRLAAADIGTTTIAMQLYDRAGGVAAEYVCVNPQSIYGADVLSRIAACGTKGRAAEHMRQMVREKLEEGLTRFRALLAPEEELRLVLAGNTTMTYLLLGHDPAELGRAPFTATYLQGDEVEIAGVRCGVMPGFSAFVGGDISAGVYACGLQEEQRLTLLIDLGTNGEMVLGNRKRQIACATAAGPAFEGGVNRGIWGADMIRLLAGLRDAQVLDETGLLADPYFDTGIRIGDVLVTQQSVRAIQLAKGAIRAGIDILAEAYGIGADYEAIERVILAGGFGYYLRPADADRIGLLPHGLTARTVSGGNTALSGAKRIGVEWIRSAAEDERFETFAVDRIGREHLQILNLAEHPDFSTLYLERMQLDRG